MRNDEVAVSPCGKPTGDVYFWVCLKVGDTPQIHPNTPSHGGNMKPWSGNDGYPIPKISQTNPYGKWNPRYWGNDLLVLNVGNFREWSTRTINFIIPFPHSHPFPTFSTSKMKWNASSKSPSRLVGCTALVGKVTTWLSDAMKLPHLGTCSYGPKYQL